MLLNSLSCVKKNQPLIHFKFSFRKAPSLIQLITCNSFCIAEHNTKTGNRLSTFFNYFHIKKIKE